MQEINTHTTLKNASYNFMSYVWPMIFSIFITPIVVIKLGIKDYGVYILINTITSILYLLAFGIGTSTVKYISEYRSTRQNEKMQNLVYSMNSIFLIIGFIGLLCFVITGFAIDFFSQTPDGYHYVAIFTLAGIFFMISSISSIFDLIAMALQRYDIGTKVSIISLTISNLGILVIASLGYKLLPIMTFQIIVIIFTVYAMRRLCRKVFEYSHLRYLWNKEEIIKSYKFGLSVFLTDIANSSLVYLDKILIPIFLGPIQLTYYSLPGSIATKISGISNSLSGVLLPITTSLNSINNLEAIKTLYIRSIRLITILSSSLAISIIVLSDKILTYWLNEDFAQKSIIILIILTVTHFFISLQIPVTKFLLALGKTKFISLMSVMMAVINAVLLVLLLPKYGIIGAAYSYLASLLPIMYVFYYVEKKYLNIKLLREHFILYSRLILTSVPFVILCRFIYSPLIQNMPTLVFFGPLSIVTFLLLYRLFNFYQPADWQDLKKFVIKIRTSIKMIIWKE